MIERCIEIKKLTLTDTWRAYFKGNPLLEDQYLKYQHQCYMQPHDFVHVA